MFKNKEKEKIGLTDEVAKFLQNGGAVEQAIGMFEVSSKIGTENNGEIIVRR